MSDMYVTAFGRKLPVKIEIVSTFEWPLLGKADIESSMLAYVPVSGNVEGNCVLSAGALTA